MVRTAPRRSGEHAPGSIEYGEGLAMDGFPKVFPGAVPVSPLGVFSGVSMRIGITADPEIPVPPNQYGGIERIVDLLVRGLIAEGHEVTLFANRESSTPCPVVAWPEQNGSGLSSIAANAWCLATEARSRHLDRTST